MPDVTVITSTTGVELSRHYVNLGKLLTLDLESSGSRSAATDPRRRRQCQRRLTTDESAESADQYRSGPTVRQLAVEWGIHRTTVLSHLRANGVPSSNQHSQARR